MEILIHSDGGARGNPGPAAYGYVLYDENENVVAEHGENIEDTTNNVAEYTGILEGIKAANKIGARKIHIRMDSQLIIKQLTGEYAVRAPHLRNLYLEVLEELGAVEVLSIEHVPRDHPLQVRADALLNQALDSK